MKALLVVLSNPTTSEQEDEYNDWYDNVHLGEVKQIPGVTDARRYVVSTTQLDPPSSLGGNDYLALYEIESEDLAAVAHELTARAVNGTFHMSGAIRADPPPVAVLFESR
ncbi:MAG: hypothetical protein ABWY58_07565 [Aeromicrobium sp.]